MVYLGAKEFIAKAALNIFGANADNDRLPTTKARNLYRLRWQIELMFKV